MATLSTWNANISRIKDLIKFPHFNYIRGDSSIDCTQPLSSVIAFCSAKIHESHFGSWANLNQERIKRVGSFYEFKGPVWIVAGTAFPQTVKTVAIVSSALVGALFVGFVTYKLQGTPRSRQDIINEIQPPSPLPAALEIIAGIGSGIVAWKLLGKIIPTTRGIFFYNFPSFTK